MTDSMTPPPLPVVSNTAASPWRVWHFVVAFVAGFVASIVGLILGLVVVGGLDDLRAEEIPADAVLAFSVPAQNIGSLIAVLAIAKLLKVGVQSSLGFDVRPADGLFILVGALVSLIVGVMISPIADALGADEDPQSTGELIQDVSPGFPLMVTFFSIVVVVPMIEELMYRGVLQRAIGNYLGRVNTILATGIIFGVVHILGLTNPTFANVVVVIVPLSLLGILLSWIADRDGRLGRAIAMHTGINALAFIATQVDLPI